jgi:hypothetical protein
VKVFAIVALVLLAGIIIMITGIGGEHGPGRHFRSHDAVETPSGDARSHTLPVEDGVQQP